MENSTGLESGSRDAMLPDQPRWVCIPDDARRKYVVRNAQGSGPERGRKILENTSCVWNKGR